MASKSRTTQEKLAKLEKDSVPFGEQVTEAAKFVDVDLELLKDASNCSIGNKKAIYHRREEWLLRWLLKKLQSPADKGPRSSSSSWLLLRHLIQAVPRPNAARILTERKLMTILQQTLEEIKKEVPENGSRTESSEEALKSSFKEEERYPKGSKKRNRSGEIITSRKQPSIRRDQELLAAIFAVADCLLSNATTMSDSSDEGRGVEFSTEYIKSVLRTNPEEAAKILGSWLSVSIEASKTWSGSTSTNSESWLVPFIEIWRAHTIGDVDQMEFSLRCTQPALSLLQALQESNFPENTQWTPQIEQLLARNVLLPAKASAMENAESELLGTLTRLPVIRDSANASILFDTAIRSLPSHGARRRRAQDESWLQTVFSTLRGAMPPNRARENGEIICKMLKKAIAYKVDLGLPVLRDVTSEYAVPEGETNWELLATILKLDANVFLVSNEGRDLLKDTLARITAASVHPSWLDTSKIIVSDVVLSLMEEFAKVRDLSGFIRHWHAQLIGFETLRKASELSATEIFSAWEHEAIQAKLRGLFEASLTIHQIEEILNWLSLEVDKNTAASCVILEAIAGSVSREEVADVVGLRLYHIMYGNGISNTLDGRYKWRAWRVLSRTLQWITSTELEPISKLWEEQAPPFNYLCNKSWSGELLENATDRKSPLEMLESLRCACAAWCLAKPGGQLRALVRPLIMYSLNALSLGLERLVMDLQSGTDLGEELCELELTTSDQGWGWTVWSYAHCILMEYPKTLDLGAEVPNDTVHRILENVSIIACASLSEKLSDTVSPWLLRNRDAFPHLLMGLLRNDDVLNRPAITSQLVEVMISLGSTSSDSWVDLRSRTAFAVKSLLGLPLEVFTRKDRERILSSWLPVDSDLSESSVNMLTTDSAMLSLKVKIMQRPTSYKGMKYQDLVNLASAIACSKSSDKHGALAVSKDLVRLTLIHITMNCDQPRNKAYLLDAVNHLKRISSKTSNKKETKSLRSCADVMLVAAVLSVLNSASDSLNDNNIIPSKELTELTTRFTESLLSQLEGLCRAPTKDKSSSNEVDIEEKLLLLSSTIDAITSLISDGSMSTRLALSAESFVEYAKATYGEENDAVEQLSTFLTFTAKRGESALVASDLGGDTSNVHGRESLHQKSMALIADKSQNEKLQMLESIISGDSADLRSLDKLLVIKHVIEACNDSRSSGEDGDENTAFDLSTAHSLLCSELRQVSGVRQFCLIVEILELMLRTKGRAMTQWNIDSALGSITIICSRHSLLLRPNRSSTIYLHLCRLMQAVLSSHRLKLQGHFHLVVQVMQTLLRCLFVPLPHTAAKIARLFAPPPWLSSPAHQLTPTHAAAYTRLVTQLCDPSVSSVTRSLHNNLTSATDKSKRMAGQHMQFLLTTYIKLQLEMKMLPKLREAMVPGLYAVFDTTTPELRRAISDGLDASGRALFGVLFRDYQRFGKWKGS